ncbi:MAG: FAD:protein FMN transferase, partial [Planctomycetes bacterium]|nr:FAD:protein FMN transferase [Planctomycetota bacterium]
MTTSGKKVFRPHVVAAVLLVILALPLYMIFLNWKSSRESVQSFFGPTMGTRYAVSLAAGKGTANWPPDLQEVQQRVEQRLAEINRRMSTYDPQSELSRFNRLNSSDWFEVSAETAEVVAAALKIAERTSGAFDPTVGPIVNLWGFGPDKSRMEIPGDGPIAEALQRVGYEKVSVRADPPALKKSLPEVYLDLSGIAKGYASDEISTLLDELGFPNTMVEIGGEVRTRGAKIDGSPWRIGVEQADDLDRQVHTAVTLVNAGMATSGDYRNFFESRGVRYSHTIDPAVYERARRRNFIDKLVLAKLADLNLAPSPRCTDEAFIRRASLDTIGTLPTAEEVRRFLDDPAKDKRDRLIESLLSRKEFVDYWTFRWADLLLVNGRRLRPDAVKAYYKWIRSQVEGNTPWDEMVRSVITAKGSSIENGATNFYALHQTPEEMSENVSQAFLGLSIGCAKCHNHPLEKWTNDQYYAMANMFARVRSKGWGGDARSGDGRRTAQEKGPPGGGPLWRQALGQRDQLGSGHSSHTYGLSESSTSKAVQSLNEGGEFLG